MKITEVKRFIVEDKGTATTIDMIPISGLPGFSHRIAINGQLVKSWLSSDYRPNRKAARFFYEKHGVQT